MIVYEKDSLKWCIVVFIANIYKRSKKKIKKLVPQMHEKAYRNSVQVIMISFLSSETLVE